MPPKRRAKANATPKPKRPPRPFDETKARKDMEQAAAAHSRLDVIGPKIRRGGNSKHISSLKDERERLETYLKCYRYPVALLPPEIIREIFLHVVPRYPQRTPLVGIRSTHVLCEVCGQWREIALGTSALWAGISVALHRNSLLPHKLELVKLALARSNSHPLSILFKADKDIDVLPFAQVLFAHSARWEHVAIKLSGSASYPAEIDRGLPLLKTLTIQPSLDGPAGDLKAVPAVLMAAFQTAPALRRIHLHFSALSDPLRFPVSQLTAVTLDYIYMDDLETVFRRAENLVQCWARPMSELNGQVDPVPESVPPITLPHLETLVLRQSAPVPRVPVFVAALVLPLLRCLRITEPDLGANPVVKVSELVQRCKCRLQEVYIGRVLAAANDPQPNAWPTPADLEILLEYQKALPSVRSISVGAISNIRNQELFYGFRMDSYDDIEKDFGILNLGPDDD